MLRQPAKVQTVLKKIKKRAEASVDTNSDMSHIMKPPEPKCPHFPLLHQPIAERTTTATIAEVKKTRHIS